MDCASVVRDYGGLREGKDERPGTAAIQKSGNISVELSGLIRLSLG